MRMSVIVAVHSWFNMQGLGEKSNQGELKRELNNVKKM
jgi:hypothetical protein